MIQLFTLFGLFLLVLAGQFFFVPVAPSILNSDFAAFHLNTEELLRGHLSFFMLRQSYGGTLAVNLLRLIFLKLAWLLGFGTTPASELTLLSVFSFIVIPFLLSTAVFFSLKPIVRTSSAWVVAASVALGWNFLLRDLYCNDYYVSYVVMGLFLLSLRGSSIHPVRDLEKKKVALAAFITGYGIYSCRAFMVIAVAFWTPWKLLPTYFSDMKRHPGRISSLLRSLGLFLLGLRAYLFFFGENLGVLAGHSVKVLGMPNLKFALICFAALFVLTYYRTFDLKTWSRSIGTFLSGAILGFSPELLHHVLKKETGILNPTFTHDFPGMMRILTQFPDALKTLVSANPEKLDSALFVLMVLTAIWTLARLSKNRIDLQTILASLAFGTLAFVTIRTYEGPAPVRYLFPILPALWFGMALLLDHSKPKMRVAWTLLILGILAPLQIWARQSWARQLSDIGAAGTISSVVDSFRDVHVSVVVTDSYLNTNQFTAASRNNPIFIGPQPWIEGVDGSKNLDTSLEIGFFSQIDQSTENPISLRGKAYTLKFLKRMGDYRLYLAHRTEFL